MKVAHLVKLSVFSKEEEDETKVLNSLLSLIPFNLEDEKIKIDRRTAQGFEHKKIVVFEVVLKKQKHTTKFLKNLMGRLDKEQKELLLRQAESRLDNKHFFIRLDKSKFMNDNELVITDSGNCFHIKISIAAFPATREKAMEIVKILLTDF